MKNLAVLGSALLLCSQAVIAETGRTDAASPWSARIGISHIQPDSSGSNTSAGEVNAEAQTGLSANVGYAFTPNWHLDVLLALPFEHDLQLDGGVVGSTKHLPPTVSLKHHFFPGQDIDVYVGAGLNYTVFFEESIDGGRLELEPSFGLAAMAGIDYRLNSRWSLGADLRYIQIETEAEVNGTDIGDVAIDPWVFSLNLVYQF